MMNTTRRRAAAGTLVVALAALALTPGGAAAATPSISVDFGTAVRAVPAGTFGVDITGYGYQHYIVTDGAEQQMLAGRYGAMRMGLKYAVSGDPTSAIVANGAGADTTVTGDAWISGIKALGAAPVVIVPENATDAANLVAHFNTGGTPNRVDRWIVGNEPDNAGESAASYAATFNAVYDAMKAVDPTIEVGGPAFAYLDDGHLADLDTFLTASGSRVDFIDFHKYGAGGSVQLCDAQLLAATADWGTWATRVRSEIDRLVPARSAAIGIQIGEINSDWSVHDAPANCPDNNGTEPVQYRNAAIWWSASVWGHLAGAGAAGYLYGDKNGALGLLYDQPDADRPSYARNGAGLDERMPVYQGLGFFTGEQGTALAHFGTTLVAASSTLDGVEVFASADPKVIVLVNKGNTAYQAVVSVGTGSTSAAAYQKDGSTVSYATPTGLGTLPVTGGQLTVALPGPSVTQLVLS
jgi:hypothetical protein